jgi:hypothetical protein
MQNSESAYDAYDLYLMDEWQNEGNVAPDLLSFDDQKQILDPRSAARSSLSAVVRRHSEVGV